MRITRRSISLALALILALGSFPALGTEAQQPGADIVMGYLANDGAVLNPFVCNERDLISVNQLVFESVVELDSQQRPVPLLADNWSVSGKTWTFKLRSEISFHNGIELVAEDVVESYHRFLQAGKENPYYGRLSLIDSMTAVDAFTLQVQARYEGYLTLYAMTFPVVQRGTVADALPRGTGPYWYIRYDEGNSFRLERNPLWWKQQPEIESIEGVRYYNTGDMLEALNAGEINCLSTRSPSAAFSRKLAKLIASDYSTTTYEMLIPNLDEASAMSDVRVRKAVMYAIDRATLVSNAYLDMAQQSEVPIIPGTWLYESQSAVYYHSPERALTLLNEAGWTDLTGTAKLSRLKNGLLVDLNVEIVTYVEANSYVRKNAAEQIAANLRAVGIQATVTALSMNDAASRVKRGNFDLALVAVNLSEVPNLFPLFSQNGAINYSGSHTAEMDQLLSRTATAASEDELKQAYGDLELHIVDRLPIMGLVFRTGTVLSTRTLAGLSGMREYDALNGLEFVKK
ncbi:MAG: hypothetical protein GX647_12705 [Clostridiales bacterium]|jgi:peptide/nickel transport system substrate-binding protein|nr:hypothetical protein [Clostridiales bacterium]